MLSLVLMQAAGGARADGNRPASGRSRGLAFRALVAATSTDLGDVVLLRMW